MVNALSFFILGASLLSPGPSLVAQTTGSAAAASKEPATYVVGPGDILEVTVLDQADVSRSTTVQPDGRFTMPLLGEIEVAGKTVGEIRDFVTKRLGQEFLVNPQVEVRVREFASQFALVLGEIVSPGRRALRGNTRLIDLLIESGGFRPNASGEIMVQRTDGVFANGEKFVRFRLGNTVGMTNTDQLNAELVLKHGDVITASPKFYVTVAGEVGRPGRVVLENDLTLLGVIADSGGLAKFGSSKVLVIRSKAESGDLSLFGPCEGTANDVCLEIDVKAIRKGKIPDVPLAPNDKVVVPRRRF